jgi:uncharacterized membrane protein
MTSFHWIGFVIEILNMAIIMAVAAMSPRLSRRDVFFSVTVDPLLSESVDGQKITARFRRDLLLFSLPSWILMLIAVIAVSNPVHASFMFLPALFLELAGFNAAFVAAHRRASIHAVAPSMEREAVVAPRKIRMPGGWLPQLGPFLILGAACFYLWLHWSEIPPRFPTHWGIDGRANSWAKKTAGAASVVPIIGAGTCLFLAVTFYAVAKGGRRVFNSGKKGEGESRYLRSVLWISLAMEYGLALIFGYLTLLPLPSHLPFWLLIASEGVAQFGFIMALFVVAIKKGHGGWRAAAGDKPALPPVGDRTPDRCWKGGLIYYNPDDPALWVEKRFGIGWTTNFGHPGAWFILGGLLLLGVLPFVLLRYAR